MKNHKYELNTYYSYSKNIFSNVIFLIPLFILYELISYYKFYNQEYIIRNTADSLIRDFLNYFSVNFINYYSLLISIFLFLVFIINRKDLKYYKVKLNYLFTMYLEGLVFAVILVFLLNDYRVIFLKNDIYYQDLLLSFYLCLGAGIWEEILFRFLLINILLHCFNIILNYNKLNIYFSIIISSILFSLFHYIGSFSDPFLFYTFTIRFIAGLFLAVIYNYRGIGISSMTHFCYDFLLISIPII